MLYRVFIVIMLILPLSQRSFSQLPELNNKIVGYVDEVMGKKVLRGECWDLAKEALNLYGAEWDHKYKFGKEVNPARDSIFPGDIIQFEKVTIRYQFDGGTYTETYPHHTAIIYEVLAPGEFRIAHQNTGFSGRKVGVSDLRLSDKKSGKIKFYRPVLSD